MQSKVKGQCHPYLLLISSMQATACLYSRPSSSAMDDHTSGSATTPPEELEAKLPDGFQMGPKSSSRDSSTSINHVDKVSLASKLTQENKTKPIEFMKHACARQGLEIVCANIKAVRTAEEVKNWMEGSCVSA